jgi:hypothetical protein
MIVLVARNDTVNPGVDNLIRFNGDTGANYDDGATRNNSGTIATIHDEAATSGEFSQVVASSGTANYATAITGFIPNYAGTTFFKTGTYDSGYEIVPGTPTYQAWQGTFTWRSTSAINQVNVRPASGNYIAGSRLTIYGIL